MRNLVTTIVLVALSFVGYSQDTEISLLVQRDGGAKIKMSLLDQVQILEYLVEYQIKLEIV